MFDIGFWEILLLGIVALLVVGPERLPGIAVNAGHWAGRLRRLVNHMRDEISEELEAEHLKKLLAEQNREMAELRRDVDDVRREAQGEPAERSGSNGASTESESTGDGQSDTARNRNEP